MGMIEALIIELLQKNVGLAIFAVGLYLWHKKVRNDKIRDMKDIRTDINNMKDIILREAEKSRTKFLGAIGLMIDKDKAINETRHDAVKERISKILAQFNDQAHNRTESLSALRAFITRELDNHKSKTDKAVQEAIHEFDKMLSGIKGDIKDVKSASSKITEMIFSLANPAVKDEIIKSVLIGAFHDEVD